MCVCVCVCVCGGGGGGGHKWRGSKPHKIAVYIINLRLH